MPSFVLAVTYTPMDRSLFDPHGPAADFMSTKSSFRTVSRSSCGVVGEDEDFAPGDFNRTQDSSPPGLPSPLPLQRLQALSSPVPKSFSPFPHGAFT